MNRTQSIALSLLIVTAALAGCTQPASLPGGNTPLKNQPPQAVASASPLFAGIGDAVTFTAMGSHDPDGSVASYAWNFGDDATGEGATTTHAFAHHGQYIVSLKIADDKGATATNDANLIYVTIHQPDGLAETDPLAKMGTSAKVVKPGEMVTFIGDASVGHVMDADASGVASWAWSFGDGASGEDAPTVEHAYTAAGTYAAKLTITNEEGDSSTTVHTIHVLPTPPLSKIKVRNPDVFTYSTIASDPDSLDPAYDYESTGGEILQNTCQGLVFYNRERADDFIPLLAAEMPTVSDDGLTFDWTIRQGVLFHDGVTELKASDVKFSIDRAVLMYSHDTPAWMLRPIQGAGAYMDAVDSTSHGLPSSEDPAEQASLLAARAAYRAANGIEVTGPYTLRMNLDYPYGAMIPVLAFTVASVMSEKIVKAGNGYSDGVIPVTDEDARDEWADEHGPSACTGPYYLKKWERNQFTMMERFDKYWGEAPPLRQVFITKTMDFNTRKLQLLTGEADAIYVPTTNDEDIYKVSNEIKRVIENPSWSITFVGMNQKVAQSAVDKGEVPAADFFADPHMRKAFAYAFDYDSFIKNVVRGHGVQARGVIPSGMFGHVEDLPQYSHDLDKAKAELAQTAYADSGFKLTITYNEGNKVREQGSLLLKQSLEELHPGIEITVQPLAFNLFVQKQRAGELPLFFLGWAPDFADPDDYVLPFASSTGAYGSHIGYENPRVDELVRSAAESTDPEVRKALYKEIEMAVYEDAPYIFAYQANKFHVEGTWVQGYYYNPMFSGNFYPALSKAGA